MKNKVLPFIILAAIAGGFFSKASAASITYYGIGEGMSGSLGSVVFSSAAYKITMPSDTSNIIDVQAAISGYPFPSYIIDGVSGVGSIEIAGVGTATFSNVLSIFSYDMRSYIGGRSGIGFRLDDGAVGDLPSLYGNFDAWNLMGPFSQTGFVGPADIALDLDMGTSMGNLRITGLSGNLTVTTVPEPSALSLLAVGLGGLAILRRRRS